MSPRRRAATSFRPRMTVPDRIEELAALRALIDRFQTINGAIAEVVARGDAVGDRRTNRGFHRMLYLRVQAPAMLAVVETVWLQLGPTMRRLSGRLGRTEVPGDHRLIVGALRAGDEPGLRLALRSDVAQGLRLPLG